jgi:hypothetical protein
MIQAATHSSYDPNKLLNIVNARLGVSSDGALSRKLKVARKLIGDIRAGRTPVGGSLLLLMHEATGISIDELRRLMGDRRAKYRLSVPVITPRAVATS